MEGCGFCVTENKPQQELVSKMDFFILSIVVDYYIASGHEHKEVKPDNCFDFKTIHFYIYFIMTIIFWIKVI